ncbi:hypothetical protein [Lacticaseibacillus mingshuiensis]|uniref:Lipoprotein n=1 Tax=Lacticaseibacillus mingshuiensis TaxID=2799574 RepID=A0ABW4CHZ2_9LACO|nr:hypothetical protein [Lacticaseibacillus mingshuiensis]
MKKALIALPLALLLVSAAGCSTSSKDTTSRAKSSTSAVKKAKASSSSEASSSDASKTSSTKKAEEASSQPATPAEQFSSLNTNIGAVLPGSLLPTDFAFTAKQWVNATTTGTIRNYTISYSEGKQALALNDASLQSAKAVLKLTKKTYTSVNAAQDDINYHPVQSGLPTVALGDGITGVREGAAGTSYVTWAEGNWSITVSASNVAKQDPLPLAKKAVAYFADHALPVPDGPASVQLVAADSDDLSNVIQWRKGAVGYTASGTDAMKLLQAAVSIQ